MKPFLTEGQKELLLEALDALKCKDAGLAVNDNYSLPVSSIKNLITYATIHAFPRFEISTDDNCMRVEVEKHEQFIRLHIHDDRHPASSTYVGLKEKEFVELAIGVDKVRYWLEKDKVNEEIS